MFAQQSEIKQFFSLTYHLAPASVITKDPSPYMHNNENDIFADGKKFEAIMGNYGYKAVGYDAYNYGALELAYKRILSNRMQFNIGLGCELSSKHWDLYDIPDGPREKRIMDYRITLLPGVDFFLLNRTENKMWLSGQAGGQWFHRGMPYLDSSERNKLNVAWQFWYVYEHMISNSFYINLGAGYGTLGVLKFGVSYAF